MNPFLLIALAAGAYYAYRRFVRPPSKLPEPYEPPALGGVAPTADAAANLALWEAIGFDVDVFPGDADLGTFAPPTHDAGISIAPGCTAVGVAHGFWASLQRFAQPLIQAGVPRDEIVEQFLGSMREPNLHRCIDEDAPAAMMFVRELHERASRIPAIGTYADPLVAGDWQPARNVPPAFAATGVTGAATAQELPKLRDAVAHVFRRRR